MSIGSEAMEELYDKHIKLFQTKLKHMAINTITNEKYTPEQTKMVKHILEEYNKHFKNFGLYDLDTK